MRRFESFIFKDYAFNKESKTLELMYSFDDQLHFKETFIFDFDFINYSPQVLDKAIEILFFICGISYFKAYLVNKIEIKVCLIDENLANFLNKLYKKGLGEYLYINNLDFDDIATFRANTKESFLPLSEATNGAIVGVGGGKDSLVVIEALRDKVSNLKTWSLNHKSKLEPLVNKIGLEHFYVERIIDPLLLKLNNEDALNGHVPISAIIASCGVIVAILSGSKDIIVGNEQSSNEPTLMYKNEAINHQYSKSEEFEKDFQKYLIDTFKDSFRYYSFLRSLSELRIAKDFAKNYFDKYKEVFSSCNRAFQLDSKDLFWCGECPKCAFMFLIFTPFIQQDELVKLWKGKNLLLDKSLDQTYRNLLGIYGEKPLDCVGEIKESRSAMILAQEKYEELKSRFIFEVPKDYDYKKIYPNSMPKDIDLIFREYVS